MADTVTTQTIADTSGVKFVAKLTNLSDGTGETLVKKVQNLKERNTKIDNQKITDILTINGIRFSLEDGSWGLIRASSNKPSLVVVTESPTSDDRKKKIFDFINDLLQKTGKIGEYDQKI